MTELLGVGIAVVAFVLITCAFIPRMKKMAKARKLAKEKMLQHQNRMKPQTSKLEPTGDAGKMPDKKDEVST